jgi:hypothetical protein
VERSFVVRAMHLLTGVATDPLCYQRVSISI